MPQVAAAALIGAGSAVASAALAGGGALAALSLSTVLGAALVSGASTAINLAFQSKTKAAPQTLQIRQATPVAQFVYGRARVSGTATFIDSVGKDLWVVVPIACHEIDAVEKIWAGEKLLWDSATGVAGKYQGKLIIGVRRGAPGQTALSAIVNDFADLNNNFRGDGHAYVALKLLDFNKFWGGTIPPVWCTVRGARCFDPRTNTTSWTANWALCVRHYLTHPHGGNKANIDDVAAIASANLSAEDVADNGVLAGSEVWAVGNNGTDRTHKRYELNGAFSTNGTPAQMVEEMKPYGAGEVFETNGKYQIVAGGYSAPVMTFTMADFKVSAPQITSPVKIEDEIDGVRARYANSAANWTFDDAPEVIFNGANPQRFQDMDLTAEPHPERAQRLMALHGRKTLRRLVLACVLPIQALALETGDRIRIEFPLMGISSDFEVKKKGASLGPGGAFIPVELLADAPELWAFDKDDAGAVPTVGKSTLPPFDEVAEPSNLRFTEVPGAGVDEDFNTRLQVSFDASPDLRFDHYVLGYSVDNGPFQERNIDTATEYFIDGLVTGNNVVVEVRAVNSVGFSSPTVVFGHAFVGRAAVLLTAPLVLWQPGINPFQGRGLDMPGATQEVEQRTVEVQRLNFVAPKTEVFCSYTCNAKERVEDQAFHDVFVAITDALGGYNFQDGADIETHIIENSRTRSVGNTDWHRHTAIFRLENLTVGTQYRAWLLLQNNYGFAFFGTNLYASIDRFAELTVYEEKR